MSGVRRFLTRRERSSRHGKQNKEDISHILSRPHFSGFFTSERTSEVGNVDQKKVKILERRILQLGITGLKEEHFNYVLRTTHGDVDKAFELLLLLEDSIEGIIRGYTPSTKLLGAENRQGVTCYLDALLFAMFARLDSFEAILYKSFDDEPRRKLAMLLRLWVNLLRSGRLITTDITKHLQDALSECGWKDAAQLRQQDTSEAFTFITEKLELPLLTLKMDIYHTGKEDVSGDHKFINERLLEVAIPEPVDGKTVTLEDCLESYFNNRIEVTRYLERRNTVDSIKSVDSISKGFTAHIETVEVAASPTGSTASPHQFSPPRYDELTPISSRTESRPSDTLTSGQHRRSSIVQERFIPESDDGLIGGDGQTAGQPVSRKGSYRKEVMMPAWQFFSLIPWYTDNTPTSDAQVAAHFSLKRPILGMCLKRYSLLPNGKAVRLSTYVDIPTEIGLPHFIQDDNMDAEGPIYGNFKLSLQALVCHRGNSVDSGHYIAIVRGTSAGAPPASSHGSDTSSDSPRYWMRFDDLAAERVTLVDIEQALKHESPYLLFYQILPINEDAAKANLPSKPASWGSAEDVLQLDAVGIAQKLRTLSADLPDYEHTEEYKSSRPSFEITTPEDTGLILSSHYEKTQSLHATDSANNLQVHLSSSASPKLLPKDEEGRRSFSFSRRRSRSTRSTPGSRASSQTGDNRISATFSRFAGRLSREKVISDYSTEDDGDEFALETEPPGQIDEKSISTNVPTRGKSKERSPGRIRDNERSKGKSKDRPRERTGRKVDRECTVM